MTTEHNPNSNERHEPDLVNGSTAHDSADYRGDNFKAWEAMADDWETFQSHEGDGNDMFRQCLLPAVRELSGLTDNGDQKIRGVPTLKPGDRVLDLGAGSGILARMFAKEGVHVTGLDFSREMLRQGQERAKKDNLKGNIEYDYIDLLDLQLMKDFMKGKEPFDVITISTTIKSLPDIEPLAAALPLMLKPGGCVVIVDLHPAFSKPAGHRGMEVREDPKTGKQLLETYIKVPRYLDIPAVRSEAVRGQKDPLWVFHRPFWSLMEPFFRNGLTCDAMREPAFQGDPRPSQAQNYHNFQQTPMLLAFRLRHAFRPS